MKKTRETLDQIRPAERSNFACVGRARVMVKVFEFRPR